MDELQRIDALLEFNVLIRELGLVLDLSQLLLDQLLSALRKGRKAGAMKNTSEMLSVNNSRSRTWPGGDGGFGFIRRPYVIRGPWYQGELIRVRECYLPKVLTECLHSIHDCKDSRE